MTWKIQTETLPELVRRPMDGTTVVKLTLWTHGRFVFEQACKLDLEGVVAKPKRALYEADVQKSSWLKIKNPSYSQKEGRQELFER